MKNLKLTNRFHDVNKPNWLLGIVEDSVGV